ncbi:U3 small nucleolar RNA-associated protein 6-domain-containing protein [Mucor mucedo]|uniref:U3 small nucleolar RNA-associated protein 6-domain-containing protein n=1 Tax=Mucor mucedo TaxID=29922 RepID=UPI0022203D40|nr:U3 small nucleolar RNA-associated protein 6-domain-containing protein [Mucor mucedo]KAI7893137.1 U3 small nucleolar RNA-associated protein 6-domain-containing protein [Mucor mucedo]
MAESVQYYLERMIPELEALEKKNIFTPVEIKSIIKKRTNFEYALQRRIKQKIDFLRCIEYEINLEDLRQKRIVRLGIKDAMKGEELLWSGIKRINNLFRRATIKFGGDLSLWLQYIEYTKKIKAYNILSTVFVQAIQFHPMNASLWIMAATWENDHNANIASARILLQRAIRLMPENQQLWHEYFRLELIYIEKIKLRRRVLGITDEDEEMPQAGAAEEVDTDNTINLPAVTGEEADAWKKGEEEMKKEALPHHKIKKMEDNNPILQGLLARITYDNAIKAIPNDIGFRQRFVDIYREFTDMETDIQYVFDTIRRDMKDLPAARAFLAERNLYVLDTKADKKDKKVQYISCNDPAFIPALRACVAEFETAIQELDVTEMWELYVKCLSDWYSLVSEENLKLYLSKLLQKTFKACEKKGKLSSSLYESWVAFAEKTKVKPAQIDAIAQQGLAKYPHSTKLWIHRVQLGQESPMKLYTRALDVNPESLALWKSYNDWILNQGQHNGLSQQDMDRLFFEACEKATTLLPSVTSASADRNSIKELLQSSYVTWAAQSQGIDAARSVYKKIIRNFYPTHPFFLTCIGIENEFGDAKTGPAFVEYLYERATRLPEDKEGTYIAYLAYLYSQKKFQLANTVYTRASKEVSDKDAFDIRVQKLKASYTTIL